MTGGPIAQPSMEELLASIRRIIADNQISPLSSDLEVRAPRRTFEATAEPAESLERIDSHAVETAVDEADDFELPAMFRQEAKGEPLRDTGFVARLTEAIRGEPKPATAESDSAKAGQAPLNAMPELRDPPRLADAPNGHDMPPLLSLRESEAPTRVEPTLDFGLKAPEPSRAPMAMPPPPGGLSGAAKDVRREMAPIKDTLIARMGQRVAPPSAAPAPPPVARSDQASAHCLGPSAFPRLPDLPAPTFGASGLPPAIPQATMGDRNFLIGEGAMDAPPGEAGSEAYLPPQLASPAPRRTLPRIEDHQMPPGYIPETTAALLRPLLMQWLDDNMQRAFTMALQGEMAESAKDDKSSS